MAFTYHQFWLLWHNIILAYMCMIQKCDWLPINAIRVGGIIQFSLCLFELTSRIILLFHLCLYNEVI
jgi:hypothetical protein